jgi:hypothetical protein
MGFPEAQWRSLTMLVGPCNPFMTWPELTQEKISINLLQRSFQTQLEECGPMVGNVPNAKVRLP